MPKKITNTFKNNLNYINLYNAYLRAKKDKTSKIEILKYEQNLENNLVNLLRKMKNNKYTLGDYRTFVIKEPKERIIKALPFEDRIVHQWYVEEFIIPNIIPKFIEDSFACIKSRGTHSAVNKIQSYMRIQKRSNENFWILKCDIKKFFYNIKKDILFNIIKKYIKDKELLKFTHLLIFDNSTDNVGIPIGNYTSQYFANIYLNELDQYIKRELKIKYYVRYMDDFILLLNTKEECKKIKIQIETFIHENLKLELNHKSRYYPNNFGLDFCGYRIWTTHRLIRTSSKKNMKRKVLSLNKKWKQNKIDLSKANRSLSSWFGHISHANSYTLKNQILKKADFLYTEFTNPQTYINETDIF